MYTGSTRTESQYKVQNTSAITDHVNTENHVLNQPERQAFKMRQKRQGGK